MGANGSLKGVKNRSCAKKCRLWFGPTIYYIFSLPAPFKISFFDTSKQLKCKSFFDTPRMPPGGCKMAPPRLKNGETGVPRDPQGCQRVPQCLPKCSPKAYQNVTKSPKSQPKHEQVDCLKMSTSLTRDTHFRGSRVPKTPPETPKNAPRAMQKPSRN
mgnify:CR=1 FL=1